MSQTARPILCEDRERFAFAVLLLEAAEEPLALRGVPQKQHGRVREGPLQCAAAQCYRWAADRVDRQDQRGRRTWSNTITLEVASCETPSSRSWWSCSRFLLSMTSP